MKRRDFVRAGAALAAAPAWAERPAGSGAHLWDGYDFGPGPRSDDRLDQGPFTIDQDEGWYTIEAKVPLSPIGATARRGGARVVEPRYDHPEFQRAFRELNQLLAARFDGDPRLEFVDLMMYGFWGEGHTSDLPSPFPDPALAERTFLDMTRLQLETWRRTPLAVNTQPDISRVGNDAVLDLAVRGGCWLRSDSVILDEPIQIEELAHRPPWLAA